LQKGAVVLMDASTGEVLAMVSFPLPSDLTKAPTPVGVNNLEQAEDQRAQFLNRALFGLYPPGSTFKIVTAIAALRKDPSLTKSQHECKPLGEGRVGNYVKGWARPVRDAEEDHAHGTISMEEAIVHSCNAYFGQFAAYDVGAFDLLGTANLFEINVAEPNTAIKLNDSLPWSAFGQGQVVASPFEMSRVAATIANGGLMPYGKWVTDDSNQRDKGYQSILDQSQNAIIARAMRAVVERGTASNLRSVTPPISGKTGTAEVENKPPHSWFIGFAPVGNRRLAFAVVVENGGFGKTSAAPVAGEIIKAVKPY
jgi:cell division protein FtsI/penicillin-binding protein 2